VQGCWEEGIAVFRGIPYARPAVGERRFRAPLAVDPWDGVRPATRFGAISPQTDQSPVDALSLPPGVPQGDDCLNLNVWTPAPGATRLPVFVWIHGGSFKYGAGSVPGYDGAAFARDGVVAVTFNYRLGVTGFLYAGEWPGAGNAGLLDQLAVLAWVQENIAAFGGDPGRVTVAGESAGADSIGQLLGAPAARGLFARAVLQSGATTFQTSVDAARRYGAEVLRRLGLQPGDAGGIAALTTADLLAAQRAAEPEAAAALARAGIEAGTITRFCRLPGLPVYGTDVLPRPALEAVAAGAARGVDLLVGTTADEWTEAAGSRAAAAALLQPSVGAADFAFAALGRDGASALDDYVRGRPGTDRLDALVPFGTDLVFRIPAIRLAETALRHHPRVYLYRFTWNALPAGAPLGATHGLDIPFTFDSIARMPAVLAALGGQAAPQSLATAMHGAWVRFAETGVPQHAALPAWPAYSLDRRATMELDLRSRLVDDPLGAERRLWDGARVD
jgi:carboxylesterase type B